MAIIPTDITIVATTLRGYIKRSGSDKSMLGWAILENKTIDRGAHRDVTLANSDKFVIEISQLPRVE